MAESDNFAELVLRIRAGDAQAAEELLQRYAPAIRREARLRLGPSLRPLLDSMDVCQSVLGSFFVRAVAGQYELESPKRLMRLLIVMTRNKVREKARRHRESHFGDYDPPSVDQDPAKLVLDQDFVHEFRNRLSENERALWERRRQGVSWAEIATESGGTAQSLRQQYSRAINRIARELGLEEAI